MPENKVTCSNCLSEVSADQVICPECGMGLESKKSTEDLLDFSDLEDETTKEDLNLDTDDLLNFDSLDEEDIELDESDLELRPLDSLESPTIPSMDTESPTIPSMDTESPTIPSIDTESPTIPSMDTESPTIPSTDAESPTVPSFDGDSFTVPSFDGEVLLDEEEEEKEDIETIEKDLHSIGIQNLLWIFFSQYTYWLLVFFIINIASLRVLEPTLLIENLIPSMITTSTSPLGERIYVFNSIKLFPFLFIFGWLSYIPMGWFFRYKLDQHNVKHKWFYPFTFMSGFFIFSAIPAVIIPNFTNSIISSLYFLLIPIEIVVTFFTLGIGTFYLGYSHFYESIYSLTPISKLPHQNLE